MLLHIRRYAADARLLSCLRLIWALLIFFFAYLPWRHTMFAAAAIIFLSPPSLRYITLPCFRLLPLFQPQRRMSLSPAAAADYYDTPHYYCRWYADIDDYFFAHYYFSLYWFRYAMPAAAAFHAATLLYVTLSLCYYSYTMPLRRTLCHAMPALFDMLSIFLYCRLLASYWYAMFRFRCYYAVMLLRCHYCHCCYFHIIAAYLFHCHYYTMLLMLPLLRHAMPMLFIIDTLFSLFFIFAFFFATIFRHAFRHYYWACCHAAIISLFRATCHWCCYMLSPLCWYAAAIVAAAITLSPLADFRFHCHTLFAAAWFFIAAAIFRHIDDDAAIAITLLIFTLALLFCRCFADVYVWCFTLYFAAITLFFIDDIDIAIFAAFTLIFYAFHWYATAAIIAPPPPLSPLRYR